MLCHATNATFRIQLGLFIRVYVHLIAARDRSMQQVSSPVFTLHTKLLTVSQSVSQSLKFSTTNFKCLSYSMVRSVLCVSCAVLTLRLLTYKTSSKLLRPSCRWQTNEQTNSQTG